VELIYLSELVRARRKNVLTYARRLHALRSVIRERSPDVIVSFLPNVNVAAVISSAFLRTPLIICERSDPLSYPYPVLWTFFCKLSYRFADMLAVQTESVARRVRAIYPGLSRVGSIPNPLPEAFRAVTAQPANERKILLSLGRLSSEKQIDKLLRAFAELAPSFIDWDLHIYGDGPDRPALERQIHELGLDTRAFMKGPTACPWKVMAGADLFVMASMYEGFPNALLEAMGVGLASVVFDCPSGPREITRDGEDALLVPLNDHAGLVAALAELMGDQALRNALGRKARESVCSRFNLAAVMQKWDCLFKEVGAIL
jgi:glycosyltransferase involved in cell wall biosynthesis